MNITKIDFPGNQYVAEETAKKAFVIHHSAGWDNARGMFNGWATDKRGRVATAYGVTDDGNIFQGFDTKFYAYALYINCPENKIPYDWSHLKTSGQNLVLEKQSVQTEICNWGGLKEQNGKLLSYAGVELPAEKTVYYPNGFRGFKWFERYTQKEIDALEELMIFHNRKDGIPLTYHPDMWDLSLRALKGEPGIWAHCSFRTDKSDAHPQPELVKMLENIEKRAKTQSS